MGNDILVFAEIREGVIKKITAEIVTAAGKIAESTGGEVHLALIGNELDSLLEEASRWVTGKVYTVSDPVLAADTIIP